MKGAVFIYFYGLHHRAVLHPRVFVLGHLVVIFLWNEEQTGTLEKSLTPFIFGVVGIEISLPFSLFVVILLTV